MGDDTPLKCRHTGEHQIVHELIRKMIFMVVFAIFVFGMEPELLLATTEAIEGFRCFFSSQFLMLVADLLEGDRQRMETAKLMVSIAALVISLAAIFMSTLVTIRLKSQDIANERKRLFVITLWDKLINAKELNAGNATMTNVLEVANTLELVSVCWDENIVDKELIKRAYGNAYSQRVTQIENIVAKDGNYTSVIQALGCDGPTLLTNDYARVVPVRDAIKNLSIKKGKKP